jgi:hypothetical protein
VLVFGEVRTCLLQNSAAANQNDVAALLALAPGERVRTSERPVAHAVSPELVSGVDCRMPAASGARVRGVGTVTGRAVVTGGRVLQGSTFARLERGQSDRRLPWSHYLARPGVIQTIGGLDLADVTSGFFTEPAPRTTVDLGALSDQVIRQVQANIRLDHVSPFKSRRTRLRWIASVGGPTDGAFTITGEDTRTFRVSCPEVPVRSVVELCEDLAMHDWLLTTVLRIVERSQIGALTGPEVLTRLRPAIDHLLHLWMPGARVATALLPFWESIERRPGFSLQWQATVSRIRDQLAVHTLETLSRLHPARPGRLESGGGSVGGAW